MRIHKIGVDTYMTIAMNVKHHPRPMPLIMGIISDASPAPKRQRHKLLPADAVAGEVGSGASQ
jgi:hypothetical protein